MYGVCVSCWELTGMDPHVVLIAVMKSKVSCLAIEDMDIGTRRVYYNDVLMWLTMGSGYDIM